jgi:hypothetical protein
MDVDELDWNRTLREQWEQWEFHWNHQHARPGAPVEIDAVVIIPE